MIVEDYACIGLAVITVFCGYATIASRIRLSRKNAKYAELYDKYNELQIKNAIIESKFADTVSSVAKAESEKKAAQDNAIRLERDLNVQKASAVTREAALEEKIRYLEKMKEDLSLKFRDISNEIIKTQHESFSAEQKNTLTGILTPFSEQLKAFKAEVSNAREESIKNKSNLDAQLASLINLNQSLSKDAQNLAEALKGNKKAQGNWGEYQLERLLEISGLRKGLNYDTQEAFHDENQKLCRPDVVIHLPEKRDIIIDSKVSLNDYLVAVNAKEDTARSQALQNNLACIKAHVDELSAKEYQKLLKDNTLDYVIMFIPIESVYIAALEADKNLYDYAYKRNVILATPLSLLPILRTVDNLWRIDNQNRNVQKIAEIGGKIYDKLAAFVDDMKAIDRGLNQTENAYKNAMTKLYGRGSALSMAENMKKFGAKTGKKINLPIPDSDFLPENEIVPELMAPAVSSAPDDNTANKEET